MGLLTLQAAQQAVDGQGNPVPFARMHIYAAANGIYSPIFEDFHLTLSLPNPLRADSNGNFRPCYLFEEDYRVVIESPSGTVLFDQTDIQVEIGTTGGGGGTDPNAPGTTVYLATDNRVFDTVADMLADSNFSYAATEPENVANVGGFLRVVEGGYVYKIASAGATDEHLTTAGGVKLYVVPNDGVVSLAQWGLVPDGTTDIHSVLQRAVDEFRAVFVPPTDMNRLVDTGAWYCSGTINVNNQVRIFGLGGTQAGWSKSVIRWPENIPGMVFHYYDTEGTAAGVLSKNANPATAPSAIGSVVENLTLLRGTGNDTTTDGVSHAIHAKVRIGVFNCFIGGWGGNGLNIVASVISSDPAIRGNANNWTTRDNRIQNCQNGMFVNGADANAGVSHHDDLSACAQWGLLDASFLGNTYLGLHTNGNGKTSRRQWNQKHYQCIDASLGATTAPDTDPDVWWEYGIAGNGSAATWTSGASYSNGTYVLASNGRVYRVNSAGSGGSTVEPLFDGSTAQTLADGYRWSTTLNEVWKSGEAVTEGGAKKVDSDSSVTSFISCYDEASQAVAYDQNVLALFPGHGVDQEALGVATMLTQKGWTRIACERPKTDGTLVNYEAFGKLGAGKFTDVHLGYLDIDGMTQTAVASYVDDSRGAIVKRDANSDTSMTWMETLFGTNQKFGRPSPVPHAKYVKKLMVGSNPANGRQVTMATAEPSSGEYARGDVIFNQSATIGGVPGWVCTTSGVAGSTAVFRAMANLSAS